MASIRPEVRWADVTIMVRPPPGRLFGDERAAHGLGQSSGQREPEPDAGAVVAVTEPLERQEHPVVGLARDAGPTVDDADLDVVAVPARGDEDLLLGRAVAYGVGHQVDQHPLQQGGVGQDLGQVEGDVALDAVAQRPELVDGMAGRPRPGRSAAATGRARRPAGGSCRAGSPPAGPGGRATRRRWPAVRRGPAGSSRSRGCAGSPRRPWRPTAGVRRSWLTAASSAVRIRSASASGLARSASCWRRSWRSATAASAANASSTRRSLGVQQPAARGEHQRCRRSRRRCRPGGAGARQPRRRWRRSARRRARPGRPGWARRGVRAA